MGPPFLGRLLARRHKEIATQARGQVAEHTRSNLHVGFGHDPSGYLFARPERAVVRFDLAFGKRRGEFLQAVGANFRQLQAQRLQLA